MFYTTETSTGSISKSTSHDFARGSTSLIVNMNTVFSIVNTRIKWESMHNAADKQCKH